MSGTDALFLSMETPSWHQHIGGLTILQQGAHPVGFSDILEMIDERIVGAPKFRWKLKSMPLGLDRPVWVDDPDFDVRRHVRRVGVPAPGGPRQTAEVAGMLLSSQLDRSRPLWELWFLENLANDRVGLVLKCHHCLLDGARQIQSQGEVASPLILSTAIKARYPTQLASRMGVLANTTVSNVPGPPIPPYTCGAKVTSIYSASIILEGAGLNSTVMSYIDRVDFGFHANPDLVPDPWAVADHLGTALAELMTASGLGLPAAIVDPFGEVATRDGAA